MADTETDDSNDPARSQNHATAGHQPEATEDDSPPTNHHHAPHYRYDATDYDKAHYHYNPAQNHCSSNNHLSWWNNDI
jgi:hypothetical protein